MEIFDNWKKSSRCSTTSCVEIAQISHNQQDSLNVLVRDSKEENGPILRFTGEAWMDFIKIINKI